MGLYINGTKIGMPYINGIKHNAFINGQKIWINTPPPPPPPPPETEYFQFTVQDNGSFNIPCSGVSDWNPNIWYQPYNWIIYWGDNTAEAASGTGSINKTIPHTYTDGLGTHQITIYKAEGSADNWLNAFGSSNQQNTANLAKIKTIVTPITSTMRTMADYAFQFMFYNCTGLTSVPVNLLPATTLAVYCYASMFHNCTSLTSAPALPATILADTCYSNMFYKCTSLTTTPNFPATSVGWSSCERMFLQCTGLTSIKPLSATGTLDDLCYSEMFHDCTSLTSLPNSVLPAGAAKLSADSQYSGMFWNCTSLTNIGNLNTNWFNSRKNKKQNFMFTGCFDITTPITYDNIPEGWK